MVGIRRLNVYVTAAIAVAFVGCVASGDDFELNELGIDQEPIVGGGEETGFPLVGTLAQPTGGTGIYPFCTATPVTPTVLITAAHCTDAFAEVGYNVTFARLDPGGGGQLNTVDAGSAITHPEWSMYDYEGYVYDIAVVRLSERINAEIFPAMHRFAETRGDVGTPLKVVGYGVSNPPDQGAGTKRSIDMSVTDIYGQYFTMVIDGWRGVCYGDSGGPSFVEGEYRNTQWGVHARTQVESCGPAEDTSVGFFYDSFVRPRVLELDPTAADCGDGICTGIEDETGCPADCSPYECGDALREGPEVCDDGNTVGGDGCSADCLSDETCGNGVLDGVAGEVCDDGNVNGGDGCSADCRSDETCGNGVLDTVTGEVCDDGNVNGGDGCSADCGSDETCGNGVLDGAAGEICDDGNNDAGDGCSADCRSDESCGNGVADIDVGEVCDDGNTISGDGCSGDCLIAEGCGNGVLETQFGEICDDGNESGGDGCSANCRSDESCGNGIVDELAGETCDDGNVDDEDDCPFDCGVPSRMPEPGMQGGCQCAQGDVASTSAASRFHELLLGLLVR